MDALNLGKRGYWYESSNLYQQRLLVEVCKLDQCLPKYNKTWVVEVLRVFSLCDMYIICCLSTFVTFCKAPGDKPIDSKSVRNKSALMKKHDAAN